MIFGETIETTDGHKIRIDKAERIGTYRHQKKVTIGSGAKRPQNSSIFNLF